MAHALRIELPEQLTGELLTGLDELDAQHAYFLALVRASSQLNESTDDLRVNSFMLELARYAQSHFAFEETLMRVYAYPNSNEHTNQHASILKSIEHATQSVPPNIAKLRLELLSWLSAHISLDDKELAAFVLKNRPGLDFKQLDAI